MLPCRKKTAKKLIQHGYQPISCYITEYQPVSCPISEGQIFKHRTTAPIATSRLLEATEHVSEVGLAVGVMLGDGR